MKVVGEHHLQAGDRGCVWGRKDSVDYSHISGTNVKARRGNDIHSMHPHLSCWEIIVMTLI